MAKQDRVAVGIDLGTTYSCIAAYRNGRAEAIQNDQGNRITPSVVCFHDGEKTVGEGAAYLWSFFPKSTIYDSKRMIGRSFDDPFIQEDVKEWSFRVTNKAGKPNIVIEDAGVTLDVTPEQVSAMVLQKLKEVGEQYLDQTIFDAVITVPAYFSDAQRQATKDAAAIAGINVLHMISEPTAAAIYHGVNHVYKNSQKLLVFDLGGGTLDVSILIAEPGMKFHVLGTHGDPHLGGKDVDNLLAKTLSEEYYKSSGTQLSDEQMARLKEQCEKAKKSLSFSNSAKLMISNFDNGNPYTRTITRDEFERICGSLFDKIVAPVETALHHTDLTVSDIQDVILIGGSSRIPKVRKILENFFGEGKKMLQSTHPDESVACGAAVYAATLLGDKSESTKALKLVDVTPFSLGVEVETGEMSVLLPKCTVLPAQQSKDYTTAKDNQTSVGIRIYEGESNIAEANRLLGTTSLDNIELGPKHTPKITVTFEIDPNGLLNISAFDKKTGSKIHLQLDNDKYNLSPSEIHRIAGLLSSKTSPETREKERTILLTRLNEYCCSVQETLTNKTGQLPSDELRRATENLKELQEWIAANQNADKTAIILKQQHAYQQFRSVLIRLSQS